MVSVTSCGCPCPPRLPLSESGPTSPVSRVPMNISFWIEGKSKPETMVFIIKYWGFWVKNIIQLIKYLMVKNNIYIYHQI